MISYSTRTLASQRDVMIQQANVTDRVIGVLILYSKVDYSQVSVGALRPRKRDFDNAMPCCHYARPALVVLYAVYPFLLRFGSPIILRCSPMGGVAHQPGGCLGIIRLHINVLIKHSHVMRNILYHCHIVLFNSK